MNIVNRKNITKLAFVIVILSFVLSTFVSLWSLRLMAERNIQELNKSLASLIYDSISSDLSEPVTVARSMAHDSLLIRILETETDTGDDTGSEGRKKPDAEYNTGSGETEKLLAEYLSGIKDAFDYEAAFVVSDASSRYYSYKGINKEIDTERNDRDQWYDNFIASGKEYDLDVDHDELTQDQWTVFVDTRIEDASGRLLGVCGVGAHLTGHQDMLDNLEREYGVKIYMIDSEGRIQINTDESMIEKEQFKDLKLDRSSDYVFQKLESDRYVVTKYLEKPDWYLVIESDGTADRKQLLNMLLLNVVLCVIVLVIMLLAIQIIIARTRALTKASFIDQPTQLYNRRAFEERKAELSMVQLKENFVYLTADLNGLKRVNDDLGHAAGDELIKGAAQCLKSCFGSYGDIYRIGGDEFAAMLNISLDELAKKMKELEEKTADWKGQLVQGLSLSCGYAASHEFPSENIAELGRISDERMYAAKEEYYRRSGKDRRR